MFGFGAKLPVEEEVRLWVDEGFVRLSQLLGRERMLRAQVVLPEDRFFPDPFDGSRESVLAMAARVATYMGVPRDSITAEIYAEDEDTWRESLPVGYGASADAGGLYFHQQQDGRFLIGVHAKKLKDPVALAATLAHELVHVLLLGGGLLDPEVVDMEPLTDLATVFLGMGVLNASAAFQFKQWTDGHMQGWSTQKSGYLPETVWGYALARFAQERNERDPAWAKMLPKNVRVYFAQSSKWLRVHG